MDQLHGKGFDHGFGDSATHTVHAGTWHHGHVFSHHSPSFYQSHSLGTFHQLGAHEFGFHAPSNHFEPLKFKV
jgi:hypothetical protein